MQDMQDKLLAFVDAAAIKSLDVLSEVSEKDTMFRQPNERDYYFFVGRQNLFTIYNLLNIRAGFVPRPPRLRTILDFGCGYGRVTRWLRAAFPQAVIHATDIDMAGPRWCAERLGVTPVNTPVVNHYDLIWVGSVFTHLAKDVATPLMAKLLGALQPGGVLAITTLGRAARARIEGYDWAKDPMPGVHFNLDKARFDRLVDAFDKEGYGYVAYPRTEDYGMCMARPGWYSDLALADNGITQIALIERADGAQDVSAFMRFHVNDKARGLLWHTD